MYLFLLLLKSIVSGSGGATGQVGMVGSLS